MRDSVLIRKKANITMLLAKKLKITPEQAIDVLYASETNRILTERRCGLHLMSNRAIVRDWIKEMAHPSTGQEGTLK